MRCRSDGRPKRVSRAYMRFKRHAVFYLVVSCGIFLTAGCAGSNASDHIIPMDYSGGRPEIVFSVPGHAPAKAVFDTGAAGHAFEIDYAEEINLPQLGAAQARSGSGEATIQVFMTSVDEMTIDGITLTNVPGVILDIPLPPEHEDTVAIFGAGLFSGSYIEMIVADETLVVRKKTPGYSPQGEEMPYSGEGPNALPGIQVDIAGDPYVARMDTGSPHGLILPLDLSDKVPLIGEIETAGEAMVLTGSRKMYAGKIDGLVNVGPIALHDPEVLFLEALRNVNVGSKLLRDLVVIMDPEEQKSWITPAN